jgi:ADP-ribosylglycohydrolase
MYKMSMLWSEAWNKKLSVWNLFFFHCNIYFSESEKDEKFEIWHYTDDTAMTRSVAKSLIENQGFDAEDMAER